jgi:ATP-dependent Clp protease ATP-binding subunit ClpA
VHQLQREDLVQILTEPKNALTRQYQRFFAYDNIELVFTDEALWEIADKALARETGARGAPLDHRDRPPRRHVRAPLAQGRRQVRDHEGDDREGASSRPS